MYKKGSIFWRNDGTISLEVYINKILDIHKFEPKKKYVKELVHTDESDATYVCGWRHWREEDVTDEIMRV